MVTESIREAKTSYNDKLSNKLKTGSLSSKDSWNTLKCFIKPQRSSVIPPLSEDSNIITNNKEKTTLFNKYLTSQMQLNDENVPLPNLTVPNNILLIQNITIMPGEVKDILSTLKLDKSSGPDGINNRVLKELSTELANPLCALFNFSLSQSTVPDSWKEANVTPILKKG